MLTSLPSAANAAKRQSVSSHYVIEATAIAGNHDHVTVVGVVDFVLQFLRSAYPIAIVLRWSRDSARCDHGKNGDDENEMLTEECLKHLFLLFVISPNQAMKIGRAEPAQTRLDVCDGKGRPSRRPQKAIQIASKSDQKGTKYGKLGVFGSICGRKRAWLCLSAASELPNVHV